MSRDPAALLGVIGGRSVRSSDQALGPQIGTVRRTVPAGVVFVLPDYDDGRHEFGPAPWHRGAAGPSTVTPAADHDHGEHVHTPEPPAVGVSCLVVFVGAGVETPVVVAWW